MLDTFIIITYHLFSYYLYEDKDVKKYFYFLLLCVFMIGFIGCDQGVDTPGLLAIIIPDYEYSFFTDAADGAKAKAIELGYSTIILILFI